MREAKAVMPVDWVLKIMVHQAICFRKIIKDLPISEADKIAVTDKVEAIDCEEFLRQLIAQNRDQASQLTAEDRDWVDRANALDDEEAIA